MMSCQCGHTNTFDLQAKIFSCQAQTNHKTQFGSEVVLYPKGSGI